MRASTTSRAISTLHAIWPNHIVCSVKLVVRTPSAINVGVAMCGNVYLDECVESLACVHVSIK